MHDSIVFKTKFIWKKTCGVDFKFELLLVRGLMAINVGCELRDRGSICSVCQITDADLGQVS